MNNITAECIRPPFRVDSKVLRGKSLAGLETLIMFHGDQSVNIVDVLTIVSVNTNRFGALFSIYFGIFGLNFSVQLE